MQGIKTLLVGMGQMGRHHFRILSEDPRFHLLGVVDPVLPALPQADIPLLRDLDAAADLDFELVVIAAPTELHFDLVRTFLSQGRHVFVEKPAAATAAEARQLVTLAQKQQRVLAVGNIERCNPVVAALQRVIASGVLGPLVHLNGIRAGGYPRHVRSGNNVIFDLGVHELDVFRMLLGPLEIVQSYGHARRQAGIIDVADISLRNAEGVTGQVHVSWFSPQRQRRIHVTGERGVAELDYIAQRLELLSVDMPSDRAGYDWQVDAQGIARASVPVAAQETLKIQLDQLYRLLHGQAHHLATDAQLIESVSLIEDSLARALAH